MKNSLLLSLLITVLLQSCVQDTPKKQIAVSVDTNGVSNVQTLGIKGDTPLSWNETTYLEDSNNDGVFEGDFEIYTAQNQIEFKFVVNDSIYELADQPNRKLEFLYQPEQISIGATFNDAQTQISKK